MNRFATLLVMLFLSAWATFKSVKDYSLGRSIPFASFDGDRGAPNCSGCDRGCNRCAVVQRENDQTHPSVPS